MSRNLEIELGRQRWYLVPRESTGIVSVEIPRGNRLEFSTGEKVEIPVHVEIMSIVAVNRTENTRKNDPSGAPVPPNGSSIFTVHFYDTINRPAECRVSSVATVTRHTYVSREESATSENPAPVLAEGLGRVTGDRGLLTSISRAEASASTRHTSQGGSDDGNGRGRGRGRGRGNGTTVTVTVTGVADGTTRTRDEDGDRRAQHSSSGTT
ncbi:hypothetical protein EAG_13736 [Camponotus floridanus]|uniref:Uncharacterized protein n=1 Tax=Camponotus floridanus TaxID=104421 RepID=E2AJU1_CAMFO|nr:hypothetical protein EAG_13736 [Camponotus floridanus]